MLRHSPGLNLVPTRWLHLTIQSVGYADEISNEQIDDVTEKVQLRLARVPSFNLHFSDVTVIEEAIVLPPSPTEPLHHIWREVRKGIADALGVDAVPTAGEQAAGFRPHVSIAYINTPGPASLYRDVLATVEAEPESIPVSKVALILQERVLAPEWVYRWTSRAEAPLSR
jgi:2'-5' RNA ligase